MKNLDSRLTAHWSRLSKSVKINFIRSCGFDPNGYYTRGFDFQPEPVRARLRSAVRRELGFSLIETIIALSFMAGLALYTVMMSGLLNENITEYNAVQCQSLNTIPGVVVPDSMGCSGADN